MFYSFAYNIIYNTIFWVQYSKYCRMKTEFKYNINTSIRYYVVILFMMVSNNFVADAFLTFILINMDNIENNISSPE